MNQRSKIITLILIIAGTLLILSFALPLFISAVILPIYITDSTLPKPIVSSIESKPTPNVMDQTTLTFKVTNCLGGIAVNDSWPTGPIYFTPNKDELITYNISTIRSSKVIGKLYCLKLRNNDPQNYKMKSILGGIDVLRSKEYLTINIDGDNKVSFN